jgi:thioredoxin-dependent peroxiredoxin
MSKIKVGDSVVNFSLPSTGGDDWSLKKLKGQTIVLYFYPRDATPGCTLEGHDFSGLSPQFKKTGAQVFGISRDTLKSHEKFCQKEGYKINLLSDEDEAACKMFDVIKMKNMYGKKVRGIERSTFVIDSKGKLVKEWRGVKVAGHAAEVLEYVKSL